MKTIKKLFAALIAVAAVGLFAGCDVLGDAYMISGVTWVMEDDIGGNTVITELNLNMDD